MEVSLDAHNLINHFVVRHLGYLQDLSVPNNSAMSIFVCDDLSPCLGDSLYKQVFFFFLILGVILFGKSKKTNKNFFGSSIELE